MSWSILGLHSALTKTSTTYILTSNDFGGAEVRITGSNFTYDPATGYLNGGSITGAALVKAGETVQTVAFDSPLAGSTFFDFFAPANTLKASIGSWGITASDTAEYESTTSIRIYAPNGTTVVFEGSGFSPFTNNGIVTAAKHYAANGQLLETVTTGMPMSAGVAFAAIGGDRGWYHVMVAGDNTVEHLSPNWFLEIDGGTGNDTITGQANPSIFIPLSYKQATDSVAVDLTLGTSTGAMGNDTLTNIQNVYGTNFNDNITGNSNANYLEGDLGDDTISGLDGADRLYGNLGSDTIIGGNGNDIIGGGLDNDVMNGGDGNDTIDYEDYNGSIAGVTVSLAVAGIQNTGGQGNDTLSNFENINGSIFNDNLSGNGQSNIIFGNSGKDTIAGNAGNDTLSGGIGDDTVLGGEGDDRLIYQAGFDQLTGDAGRDTVDFGSFGSAVWINLEYAGAEAWTQDTNSIFAPGATWRAIANLDTIEDLVATAYDDLIAGNSADNVITFTQPWSTTAAVFDRYDGRGGSDTVRFDGLNAAVWVNLDYAGVEAWTQNAASVFVAGPAWKELADMTSIENIWATNFNDKIFGSTAANTFTYSSNGALTGGLDLYDGRGGVDTASFAGSSFAVWVDLAYAGREVWTQDSSNVYQTGASWRAIGDLVAMENITGSSFNDWLAGDAGANILSGGLGNDTLSGRGGADTYRVSSGGGTDTIIGFAGGSGVIDRIELSGFGTAFDTFAEVFAVTTQVGNNTQIALNGTTIVLKDIVSTTLNQDDFLFV